MLFRSLALIDRAFGGATLADAVDMLAQDTTDFSGDTLKRLQAVSPLSAVTTFALIRTSRELDTIEAALELEYRATYRAIEHGDLLEGIRAQIIDKDRNPNWRHASIAQVPPGDAAALLAPLGDQSLNLGAKT